MFGYADDDEDMDATVTTVVTKGEGGFNLHRFVAFHWVRVRISYNLSGMPTVFPQKQYGTL